MSATCPNCGTAIEQDFGLVNCTGCGKLVSVDVDGIVQSAELVPEFEGPPDGLHFSSGSHAETTPEEFAPMEPMLEGLEVMPELTPDQPIAMHDVIAAEATELPPIQDPNLQYQDAPAQDDLLEFPDLGSPEAYTPAAPEAGVQLEDFSDAPLGEPQAPVPFNQEIADFANQEVSSPAGALTYEVEVTGIDSGAVRTEVLRALVDPRFSWSPSELGSKIKSGRLVLSPLHPAAAVIVVRRLQPLNVRLQWRQTRNG